MQPLIKSSVTETCKDFIARLLVAEPQGRSSAEAASRHGWFLESDAEDYHDQAGFKR